jgi:cobyrinic acid a,c-diamide synthase
MNVMHPRLVLAALRGGAGKTTISVALAVALKRRGIGVVPFKKGPDYIDAAWLSLAAGAPCYNLDTFLIGREQVVLSVTRRAPGGSLSLIEGNRGLYDGMNPEGEHSTAELAKLLRSPVVLVVDCDKVTRTTGAMVLGCQMLDPEVDIRGAILNRVGGKRHAAMAQRSIEEYGHIPVLGVVPRMELLPFPERHLGLVPPQEHELARRALDAAGDMAERYLNVEGLIRIARDAPAWSGEEVRDAAPAGRTEPRKVRIGVIRDSAFQFYYYENIEALTENGAEIVEISAVGEQQLPDVDALYIGGGFPETQAERLSKNEGFRRSLRDAAEKGLPIYAECGGFIYLGESLTVGDVCYPMVGALPLTFGMEKRPQGHGYTVLEADGENPFYPVGTRLNGHEFHYCRILSRGEGSEKTVFHVTRGTGMDGKREGMTRKNILAGFTHVHALGTPQWAPALIGAAERYRAERCDSVHEKKSFLSRG